MVHRTFGWFQEASSRALSLDCNAAGATRACGGVGVLRRGTYTRASHGTTRRESAVGGGVFAEDVVSPIFGRCIPTVFTPRDKSRG